MGEGVEKMSERKESRINGTDSRFASALVLSSKPSSALTAVPSRSETAGV